MYRPLLPLLFVSDGEIAGVRWSISGWCAEVRVKNLLSVRCLMTDFSKALDRVSHPILLSKLSKLELLDWVINWIISYLTGRTQVVKCNRGGISLPANINTSNQYRSGIWYWSNAIRLHGKFVFITVVHTMSISTDCMYVCYTCDIKYQSINQYRHSPYVPLW